MNLYPEQAHVFQAPIRSYPSWFNANWLQTLHNKYTLCFTEDCAAILQIFSTNIFSNIFLWIFRHESSVECREIFYFHVWYVIFFRCFAFKQVNSLLKDLVVLEKGFISLLQITWMPWKQGMTETRIVARIRYVPLIELNSPLQKLFFGQTQL